MAYLGNLAAWLDKILGSFSGASISGKTITLTKHSGDTVTLTTQDTVYTHPTTAGNKHIPSGGASGNILRWKADGEAEWGSELDPVYADATTSAHGLMSATDKTKLDGIASGAEVNQNAFSTVKVGTTNVAADSKTDTLTLVAGSNVTLTPDATNDKITIAATDTTYSAATTSADGLMSSTDKAKLDGVASGAEVNQNAFSRVTIGSTNIDADAKSDTLTIVAGNNITLTPDANNDKITIAATDTIYTHPTYTARTGKPTTNATPGFGGTVTISQITSDATGHVTGATDRTITIPSAVATSSANGLMSSTDKAAFDAMQTVLSGGTTGQVLVKTASGYGWSDLVDVDVNPSGDE